MDWNGIIDFKEKAPYIPLINNDINENLQKVNMPYMEKLAKVKFYVK